MPDTIALPALYNVRMTQDVRIAVGIKRDGQNHPQKLDHFVLTRYSPQVKSYVIDREAMTALAEYLGVEADGKFKPRRLPIQLLANLETVTDVISGQPRREVPELILRTRMAFYWGPRVMCASEGFILKDKERCERDGIDFPPDPEQIVSWVGRARVRKYDSNGRLIEERKRACNPGRCPFATGTHDLGGTYAGRPVCKPQSIFQCQLPFLPRLGAVARFATTSWQSTAKLRSSLLLIGAQTHGWLAMLPLELVVRMERVSSEGYIAPIVHVEFSGDIAALREKTLEVKQQLVGLEQQIAAISSGDEGMRALDAGEEAEAFVHEFAPDVAEAAPDVAQEQLSESYLQQLVEAAGWTDAQLEAALQSAEGNVDAVIEQLEGETGRDIEVMPEEPEANDDEPADAEPEAEEGAEWDDPFPDAPESKEPQRLL